MYNKIDIVTIGTISMCVDHYNKLSHTFTQLTGGKDAQPLRDFWETKIVKRSVSTAMTQDERMRWFNVDLHLVNQMWGSTSGGWGGIGGAAMTTIPTLIIENHEYGLACVYYGTRLAYICEIDDKYTEYQKAGYVNLPGHYDCQSRLTVIFKPSLR
jgi:hypothetical protein